jgi:manganese transport protein
MAFWKNFKKKDSPGFSGLEIIKYIGPGLLVTVGFIDPGNWASNLAAGSMFGYSLLWIVTLSTVMLIFLQHNAAHLGIVTGLCLSEASSTHFSPWAGRALNASAMAASVSTSMAEILGAAIGLNMLTGLPIPAGAVIAAGASIYLLLSNSYRRTEKYIIGFVSVIGLSFLFEISLVEINWGSALSGWFVPSIPSGSMMIIMSILGAVVMPHNLYLHSEIIQSRQWNKENENVITGKLRYEMTDTIVAMLAGWAINSAMILIAASVFNQNNITVTEVQQAHITLRPILGDAASIIFAVALIFAGLSSSITAAMAGGSIFAGIFGEPFDIRDRHSKTGILITMIGGLAVIFFLADPFKGLIWSQIILSIQLPWSIISLITLTSSKKVMGKHQNTVTDRIILFIIASAVIVLNIILILDLTGIYKI